MNRFRRAAAVLSIFALMLLVLEIALRTLDPSGAYGFMSDLDTLWHISVSSPDGLRYLPGYYPMRTYTLEVGVDGFRTVPESRAEHCRIAFVGDSMTLGMGSDLSFVDLLAPDMPATVINGGIAGYSVTNVQRELNVLPADGYIWLIYENDADDDWISTAARPTGHIRLALEYYSGIYIGGNNTPQPDKPDLPYFRQVAGAILARDDALAFAYEDTVLTESARELGAHIIPKHTLNASRYDAHPSEAGAAQIADAMREDVLTFTHRICG